MFVHNVSTRSLSTDDLVALLRNHPDGVEIRRGDEVLFVILGEEHFRSIDALAWLASDPERYKRVAGLHETVQSLRSLDEQPHLFLDTFPS